MLTTVESENSKGLMLDTNHCPSEMSQKLLWDIACWVHGEPEITGMFPDSSAAVKKQLRLQINRDLVRVTMLVLSYSALDGRLETFSIRKLARVLDRPKEDSMQRTLRNWLLPLLQQTGWIEGFILTSEWSTTPHEISITEKGLLAMKSYFERILDVRS